MSRLSAAQKSTGRRQTGWLGTTQDPDDWMNGGYARIANKTLRNDDFGIARPSYLRDRGCLTRVLVKDGGAGGLHGHEHVSLGLGMQRCLEFGLKESGRPLLMRLLLLEFGFRSMDLGF